MAIANRQITGSGVAGVMYPNGTRPNIKNPIYDESARPAGTMFGNPSGKEKTAVANPQAWPGPTKFSNGFADDLTGFPWASPDPGFMQGGGPMGTEAMTKAGMASSHNPSKTDGGDTRAKSEKITDSFAWAMPGSLSGIWAEHPVASLMFGVAFIWIANEVLFRSETVSDATSGTATVVTAPAKAVTSGTTAAAGSAVDSVNTAASKAVETVEDAVAGLTGDKS